MGKRDQNPRLPRSDQWLFPPVGKQVLTLVLEKSSHFTKGNKHVITTIKMIMKEANLKRL